ncbi:hypothetical protein B6I21_03070 [candidate division KSB1 bacterium 4572_119]|nr:MAG: hypothetical protein B6I21_03070 [candidate division KSB1 bacterium 4572_119]
MNFILNNNLPRVKTSTQTVLLSFTFIFVIFLIFSPGNVISEENQQSVKFSGVDSLVDVAVDYFYQKKFDVALNICDSVINLYPENPLGYLGKAGVYHLLMLNYRVNLFDQQFDSLTTLAIEAAQKAVIKYKKDADAFFVLGSSYGFRGLNRIRRGEWLSAFYDGMRGMSNIRKAHRLDNEMWDVYYAFGLFYYWKSAKAKVLTFLRLMKDEREKGIEYLKIAIEKGKYTSEESKFALIEIYYYEDRYHEALKECNSISEIFRDDPTWNYLMAKIYGKLNQWKQAKIFYTKLLELLEQSPFKSYSFFAECHYGLAKCAFETKDFTTAESEIKLAIKLSEKWDKKKEIEGPLLDFDLVLKRIKKLENELKEIIRQ